jgi:4-carboxymuconolactone decarboxylase
METKGKTGAYLKGIALMEQLHGGHAGEQMVNELKDIAPDHIDHIMEWALGGIMARPGLDLLTREYLLIASCTTLGFAAPQLRAHIEAAVKIGGTKEQIVEVILQMLFYAGGVATSNALRVAREVFAETPVK